MKRFLALLVALCLAGPCRAQQMPQPSAEGKQALDQLIEQCRQAGAFRIARHPQTGAAYVAFADRTRLPAVVAAQRSALTPALRDALIVRANVVDDVQTPPLLALLRAVARETKDDRTLAFAALEAGSIRRHQANLEEARKETAEAVRLFAAVHETGWQAIGLNDLGLIDNEQGKNAQALEHYRQALEIFSHLPRQPNRDVASCLSNIGNIFLDQGQYADALDHFQRALRIEQQVLGEDDPVVAVSLVNIAAVYSHYGEYDRALKYLQRAVLLLREAPTGRDVRLAIALEGLANVYEKKSDYDKALERHLEALEILRGRLGNQHPDVAYCLANIGVLLRDQGKLDKALESVQLSLEIRQDIYGKHHPDVAHSLQTLGAIYQDKKDDAHALDCYEQALEIRRHVYGSRHPDVADSLFHIAYLHARRHEYVTVVHDTDAALAALRQSPGEEASFSSLSAGDLQPLALTVNVLYARGFWLEQQLDASASADALRACDQCYTLAAAVQERVRQQVLETEAGKLLLGASQFDLFAQRIGVLHRLFEVDPQAEHLRAAFITAEQGTARVFREQLGQARAQVIGQVSADLRRQEANFEQALHDLDERLAREQARLPDKRDPEAIGQLFHERAQVEEDRHQLVARMERTYPQYAALKYPRPCSVEEARACLKKDEVALLYVPGTEASYLVLLEGKPDPRDRAGGLAVYPLPSAGAIASQVEALTDPDILALPARVRALGAESYQALLAPCARKIQGKDLVIVPGGALGYLPFEMLVESGGTSGPEHYLVEKHRIRYAPSMTALVLVQQWEKSRARPVHQLWAMGDPVYETTDERLQDKQSLTQTSQDALASYLGRMRGSRPSSRLRYERLTFSGQEVQAIRAVLGAAADDVLTGLQASEAMVKAASEQGRLAQARYVHFATHGILGLDVGRQPSLVLSLVGNGVEDGFLQLDEVTHLKLNADLVVLSACQSGQGELRNGEGVRGLARAFLYAGSRAVLCSLWSIADRETAHLMADVYRHLKQGRSSPDALREAQLTMIRAGKAPRSWAPFIVIGE